MYFLSKFCRICVKSSGELKDIDTVDYDSIKFSEKLKVCTKMVISKESLSSSICTSCINKLRISYEFDNMCKKSTIILQGYLSELIGSSENSASVFASSELYVQLSKLPPQRKHRHYVTKEQRCSLLKELLTKIKDDKKRFNKKNIKTKTEAFFNLNAHRGCVYKNKFEQKSYSLKYEGLKTLINFTKFYNYGYSIDEKKITDVKFDSSSLDKLAEFVNTFFRLDLTQYHNNISYVLEQTEEWTDESDIEDMFNKPVCENLRTDFKFEEVIVEPDINIKKEMFTDESETESNGLDMCLPSSSYFQTCNVSHNKVQMKIEPEENIISDNAIGYLKQNRFLAEIIPLHTPQHTSTKVNDGPVISTDVKKNSELYPILCQSLDRKNQSTLDLLQEYTEQKFRKHRKPFSHNNAKCRTKNQPFISPQLKRQFLHQDFKCSVCNRRFKSQGYLQAHYSKMKHKPR